MNIFFSALAAAFLLLAAPAHAQVVTDMPTAASDESELTALLTEISDKSAKAVETQRKAHELANHANRSADVQVILEIRYAIRTYKKELDGLTQQLESLLAQVKAQNNIPPYIAALAGVAANTALQTAYSARVSADESYARVWGLVPVPAGDPYDD